MRFTEGANKHFKLPNKEALTNEVLMNVVNDFESNQVPRLQTLKNYYLGNNDITKEDKRRREEHLADNRASHNFAKYVSQFIQGYMMGVPLKTAYPDDDDIDKSLREINRINDADEHNSALVLDQSIYGRAYELLYRSKGDENRFAKLDVESTFVIYDESVEMNPLFGVRIIESEYTESKEIHLYSDTDIKVYDATEEMTLKSEEGHKFDGVPIIEYQNDDYRQGDFEDALTLIDLYDAAQSDTANYMQDLNDAMLVIKGHLEIDTDKAKEMKDANTLILETELDSEGRHDNSADAFYIYKEYDVAGTEAYKDRVFNNILLFTSIPNLLDDGKSSGVASGEALKMKLFALSQKRATKERMFKKSLRDRYRLINNLSSFLAELEFDPNDISITFTENLPSMIDNELSWFTKAGGTLSQHTLLSQLSFVENADEEIERIEQEDEQVQQGLTMYKFTNYEGKAVSEVDDDEVS